MTNLTIGRVGLEIDISGVAAWDEQGDKVSISATTPYGSVPNAMVLRQQLGGLVDSPDEDFVPVTWADQPEVNGFYRVLSASVNSVEEASFAGFYSISVQLEKVAGFAAPSIEAVITGAVRVNGNSIVAVQSQPTHCVPDQVVGYDPGVAATFYRRGSEDGTVRAYFGSGFYNAKPSFFLSPANWYKSAATLRIGADQNGPGSVVTGRQVKNLPNNWSISNGVCRIQPDFINGDGGLSVSAWDGSNWKSMGFWPGLLTTTTNYLRKFSILPHTITVLRNTPEEVSIRITYDNPGEVTATQYPVAMDLTLRRGSRMVQGRLSCSSSERWGIVTRSLHTKTDYNGGRTFHTTLGSGTPYLVLATSAAFVDSVDNAAGLKGVMRSVAFPAISFGAGISYVPTGSTAQEPPQTLIYQYYAAQNEKATVVAR